MSCFYALCSYVLSCLHGLQGSLDGNPDEEQAPPPAAQAAAPAAPHGKGRRRRTVSLLSDTNQQQPGPQPHFARQQLPVPAHSATWQTDTTSAHMYTAGHTVATRAAAPSSMFVQQPQLCLQSMLPHAASASTRVSSSASGSASSASLDGARGFAGDQHTTSSSSAAQPEAAASAATAGSDACRGGSLYACTPPGRPPGRRCAVLRWVLNQRALWREGQLTPVQMQYMAILGELDTMMPLCIHSASHCFCFRLSRHHVLCSRDHISVLSHMLFRPS